jgi:hypothetical protein
MAECACAFTNPGMMAFCEPSMMRSNPCLGKVPAGSTLYLIPFNQDVFPFLYKRTFEIRIVLYKYISAKILNFFSPVDIPYDEAMR